MVKYIGDNIQPTIYEANGVWTLDDVASYNDEINWPNPRFDGTLLFTGMDVSFKSQPFCQIMGDHNSVTFSGISNNDIVYKAEPFLINHNQLINSNNPSISTIITESSDPYWSNVVLLIRGSGTIGGSGFVDSSTYNHTLTTPVAGAPNNASFSSGSYIFNTSSIIMDGDGDYIQLPVSSNLAFASGAFTAELWMKTNGGQDPYSCLFSQATANTIFLLGNGTSLENFGGPIGIGNIQSPKVGSYTYSLMNNGNWHHVALTRSGTNGSNVSLFIDGTLVAYNNIYNNLVSSLSNGRIGRDTSNNALDNNYNGYLDEIRVTKGICRYNPTTTFSVPSSAYPEGSSNDPYWNNVSLLLHMDGSNGSTTFTDSSPRTKIITPSGNSIISTTQSKFGGSSYYFDGNGDFLNIPADTDFTFGTGDFTIEAWIYLLTYTPGGLNLFTTSAVSTNFNTYIFTDGQMRFWDGATTYTFGKAGDVPLNSWVHVAWSRQSSIMRVYSSGVLVGATSINTSLTNSLPIMFPATTSYLTGPSGYIDELRITKGISRYNVDSFTPPRLRFYGG